MSLDSLVSDIKDKLRNIQQAPSNISSIEKHDLRNNLVIILFDLAKEIGVIAPNSSVNIYNPLFELFLDGNNTHPSHNIQYYVPQYLTQSNVENIRQYVSEELQYQRNSLDGSDYVRPRRSYAEGWRDMHFRPIGSDVRNSLDSSGYIRPRRSHAEGWRDVHYSYPDRHFREINPLNLMSAFDSAGHTGGKRKRVRKKTKRKTRTPRKKTKRKIRQKTRTPRKKTRNIRHRNRKCKKYFLGPKKNKKNSKKN